MKILFRFIACIAFFLFAVATIIKLAQGVSYKDAVGIMEEYWKEIKECCKHRCTKDEETAPEG